MNVLPECRGWMQLVRPGSALHTGVLLLLLLSACAKAPGTYVSPSASSRDDDGGMAMVAPPGTPSSGTTPDATATPVDLDSGLLLDAAIVEALPRAPFGSVPASDPFYVLGPGASAVGEPGLDTGDRLNVAIDEGQSTLLSAGRYNVYAFRFASGSNTGSVTPFLSRQLSRQPLRHEILWLGPAYDSVSQGPVADAGVSSELVLSEPTRVYAGFFTRAGGRVAYVAGGATDHDDSFAPIPRASAPDGVVEVRDFSSPSLVRTYRFSVSLTAAGTPPPATSASTGLASDKAVTLDLRNYELSFHDEFEGPLDISASGPGTRWTAHTPYNGDFGDALFTDPSSSESPFRVADGLLHIRAWYDAKSKHWRSGLISSVDPRGDGFAQQYGYFEMRAKLPSGPGTWPAFWALDRQSVISKGDGFEADVVEQYGHAPGVLHQVWHLWPKSGLHSAVSRAWVVEDMTKDFHTYGFLWDADVMIWYFDGKEMWRQPTVPEARTPLYLMVNLALGSGWPIDQTPNPSVLLVDHVRAYRALPRP